MGHKKLFIQGQEIRSVDIPDDDETLNSNTNRAVTLHFFGSKAVRLDNVTPREVKDLLNICRDVWPAERKDSARWDGALVETIKDSRHWFLFRKFRKGDEAVVTEYHDKSERYIEGL